MSNYKLQNIVAGTSLDMASDRVVARAAELARRSGARLHLAHAHALPLALYAAPAGLATVPPDLLEAERQIRQELLNQQLDRIGIAGELVSSSLIEAGAPHRVILEAARTCEADLIVLGGSEEGSFQLLGSNADRVLRKAVCPVWVVQTSDPLAAERILAPVDLSEIAGECLGHGIDLLSAVLGESKPPLDALLVVTAGDFEADPDKKSAEIEATALAELKLFLAGVRGAEQAAPLIRSGDVRAEILAAAREKSSLLVLATHGRSGFERFLLGSVASDVAAKSEQDVLIVPPAEAAS